MDFFPTPDPAGSHQHDSDIYFGHSSHDAPGRTAWHGTSREDLNARRRAIEDAIEAEGDAAVDELEEKLNASRIDRRSSRRARVHHADYKLSRAEEEAEEDLDDMYEICDILMDEYGVEVEPLPEGARGPIFGRKVKAAIPVEGKGVEKKTSDRHKEKEYLERRHHARNSGADETSDEEDEMLVKSMSRGRSDLLKAETGMSGSTPGVSRSSFRYGVPVRRESSGRGYPYDRMRHAPYPMRPPPPHVYEPHLYSVPPHRDSGDYSDSWISASDDERIALEIPSHDLRPRHRRRRAGDRKRRSDEDDDDSYEGRSVPVPKPRGPGPRPSHSGPGIQIVREHDWKEKESRAALRREEKKAAKTGELDASRTRRRRPEVVQVHRPTPGYYPEAGGDFRHQQHDTRRTRSYGDPTTHVSPADYVAEAHEASLHRYREAPEPQPQSVNPIVYMSGGRHAESEISGRHGSDDDGDILQVRRTG